MGLPRFIVAALAAVAAGMLAPLPGIAGSFGVSPLRLDLGTGSTMGALTVRSDSDRPTVVQAELFVWEQDQGADRLTPTRDLLVSPAVFTLQPSGTQLLRVGLRRAADPQRELSYRLILTEVPASAEPGFSGLTVALRLSLPVFIAPQAPAESQVHWAAGRSPEGNLTLTAHNAGQAHVRLLNFSLTPATGTGPIFERSVAAYVLPGQSRTWVIDQIGPDKLSKADWHHLRLTGLAATGPVVADISLELD